MIRRLHLVLKKRKGLEVFAGVSKTATRIFKSAQGGNHHQDDE